MEELMICIFSGGRAADRLSRTVGICVAPATNGHAVMPPALLTATASTLSATCPRATSASAANPIVDFIFVRLLLLLQLGSGVHEQRATEGHVVFMHDVDRRHFLVAFG